MRLDGIKLLQFQNSFLSILLLPLGSGIPRHFHTRGSISMGSDIAGVLTSARWQVSINSVSLGYLVGLDLETVLQCFASYS